nr:MAG TPA: hypothetical protein [Caudoviricetes sp.]
MSDLSGIRLSHSKNYTLIGKYLNLIVKYFQ